MVGKETTAVVMVRFGSGEDTWLATGGCRKGVVVGGFAAAGWWARE